MRSEDSVLQGTVVAQCLHSMRRICQPVSSPHIHMARMAGGPPRCDVMGFATSLRPQCPYEGDTYSSVHEFSVKRAILKSEATLKCFFVVFWSLCYWIYFKKWPLKLKLTQQNGSYWSIENTVHGFLAPTSLFGFSWKCLCVCECYRSGTGEPKPCFYVWKVWKADRAAALHIREDLVHQDYNPQHLCVAMTSDTNLMSVSIVRHVRSRQDSQHYGKAVQGSEQEVFFGTIPHVPLRLLQGERDVNTARCVICSSVSEALVCFFWPCRALSWEPDSLVTHKQGLFQVALYHQSVGDICDQTVVNISLFCPRRRHIGTQLAPHHTWIRILKILNNRNWKDGIRQACSTIMHDYF